MQHFLAYRRLPSRKFATYSSS